MAAKSSKSGGNWVTINGVHVLIENGKITKGPAKFIGSTLNDLPSSGKSTADRKAELKAKYANKTGSGKNAHPRIGKHNLDSDTVRPRELGRGYTESNKISAVIASKKTGGAVSPKELYSSVRQKKDLTYKKEKAQDDYRLASQSNNHRTASGAKRRYDNASDKLQNLKNSVKDKVSTNDSEWMQKHSPRAKAEARIGRENAKLQAKADQATRDYNAAIEAGDMRKAAGAEKRRNNAQAKIYDNELELERITNNRTRGTVAKPKSTASKASNAESLKDMVNRKRAEQKAGADWYGNNKRARELAKEGRAPQSQFNHGAARNVSTSEKRAVMSDREMKATYTRAKDSGWSDASAVEYAISQKARTVANMASNSNYVNNTATKALRKQFGSDIKHLTEASGGTNNLLSNASISSGSKYAIMKVSDALNGAFDSAVKSAQKGK